MSETRDTYLLLRAFADELVRAGVRHACTSPGSRSAPIVLSLARQQGLTCFSHVDERCAGFFALGAAKATGMPAVVACTSGTAAANYLPAVAEARDARVPLIVVTADRPPELRDVGAGQAIDQLKLYGGFAKWFVEVGQHAATPERLRWVRQLAARSVITALEGRPGVVHLNWPLREPLILEEELEPDASGRPGGEPWISRVTAPAPVPPVLANAVRAADRPVVVAGRLERGGRRIAEAVHGLGVPLLADPLSRLRTGPAAVAHYDALLADDAFAAAHEPDLVVRIGDLPTSKALRTWLGEIAARQIAVDPESAWQDPAASVALRLECDPGDALAAVAGVQGDAEWLKSWRTADLAAARAHATALGDAVSEPAVARHLVDTLPAAATLFVAASMPIRDVERFGRLRDDPPRILANRGANGIDGTISSAFGVAAASEGPVVLLIGDVALAHDLGGLLAASRLGLALTVVVLDNGGGGIFDFLPVSTQRDAYEEHVATPTGLDVERVAGLFGCRYVEVGALEDIRPFPGETVLLHVRSDRAENVALHRQATEVVQAALQSVRGSRLHGAP